MCSRCSAATTVRCPLPFINPLGRKQFVLADKLDMAMTKDAPPLNVLGGYRFPGAPELDSKPGASRTALNSSLLVDDGHPSGVPAFLRRAR
jgi:hypothetical protein